MTIQLPHLFEQYHTSGIALEQLLETILEGIIVLDTERRLLYLNATARRVLGIQPEMIQPTMLPELSWRLLAPDETELPPEDHPFYQALHGQNAISGREVLLERPHGDPLVVRVSAAPLLDAAGEVKAIVEVFVDITERKRAEELIHVALTHQQFLARLGQQVLDSIPLPRLFTEVLTNLGALLGVPYCELLEYLPEGQVLVFQAGIGHSEELPGTIVSLTGSAAPDYYALVRDEPAVINTPLSGDGTPAHLRDRQFTSGVTAVVPFPQHPYGILGVFTSSPRAFTLAEQSFLQNVANMLGGAIGKVRYEEQLRYLGTHDALTNLYNRTFFEEELARLDRGRRSFPVTIMMIDVDGLKKINDRYGHAAGDAQLQRVGEVLRIVFRAEDVVARLGGDEFAILLPRMDAGIARAVQQRMENILSDHNALHSGPLLSFSLGVATANEHDQLLQTMALADQAMYAKKQEKQRERRAAAQQEQQAEPPKVPRILLVEDSAIVRQAFTEYLTMSGYQVVAVADSAAALTLQATDYYDLVLVDYRLPVLNGDILIANVTQLHPTTRAILMSVDLSVADIARRCGAHDWYAKGSSITDLLAKVRALLAD